MLKISVQQGETVDKALKKLKTIMDNEGILDEIRRRKSFEKPAIKKARKERFATKYKYIRWKYTPPAED